MSTHLLDSRPVRQLLGAALGMAIATVLYFGIDQLSMNSLKGYLVSPGQNISEKSQQVRINDKNVDDESLRRIAYRARTVATEMQEAKNQSSAAPLTALEQNAQIRLATRQGNLDQAQSLATPVEYVVVQNQQSTQYDRLKLRQARLLALQSGNAGQALAVPGAETQSAQFSSVPPEVAEPKSAEAPVEQSLPQHAAAKDLPNSGIGLWAVLAVSLLVALAWSRPVFAHKLVAALQRAA